MARNRTTSTSTVTPETSVVFYSSGGHNHNGVSSSLIDTSKYSIFDFNPGNVGNDSTRRTIQDNNLISFRNFIITTVNDSVLAPAGVVLGSNTVNADNIQTNSITAAELSANLVLINNIIRSNTYVANTSGWSISYNGDAEFNNVTVRGTVVSNSGTIGGWTIGSTYLLSNTAEVFLTSNGFFQIGSNANNSATITPDGDFTVVGYDGTTSRFGITRFFGPWFKIVTGTDLNANVSQAQLTDRALILANNSVYNTYIAVDSPGNPDTGARFISVKNGNTEVLISNSYVTASNANASFNTVTGLDWVWGVNTVYAGKLQTAYWATTDGVNRAAQYYTDMFAYAGSSASVGGGAASIVLHNQGGALTDSFHSWTGGHYANWLAGPNPRYRLGMIRDGWGGYIEFQYAGAAIYSSSAIINLSDQRLKTNIRKLNDYINPINILENVEPKIYEFISAKKNKLNEDGSLSEEMFDAPDHFGFVAQDFLAPLEDQKEGLVKTIQNPDYDFDVLTLDDRGLISILWGAVRDINNRLKAIESINEV